MIRVRNLGKTFVTQKRYPGFLGSLKGLVTREKVRTVAVDDVSFDIDSGEIVGYIGANGAGKSTTIKMMTGILTPSSGRVTVDGVVPWERRMANAANIGVVFGQRTQLWWDLPVTESLTLLRDVYGVPKGEYEKRLALLDEVLALSEFASSPVRTLSLGQRMRADLAASLLHRPKVLYLDEPTIGLDLIVKEKVRKAIKELNREFGTTIILTTHDLADIEELCRRIIVIDSGRLVYDGSLDELRAKYGRARTVRFHLAPGAVVDVAPLAAELAALDSSSRTAMEEGELAVTFDRAKAGVGAVVQKVLARHEVLDYAISETKIEEIVKRIYLEAEAAR
ncbi:MAG TPA: ATP-binding cassette domain-containing protein [Spirochaetales bacterium]|nr:ATP-binding cassette domain-containing protein [Spirochaetales bacterium]